MRGIQVLGDEAFGHGKEVYTYAFWGDCCSYFWSIIRWLPFLIAAVFPILGIARIIFVDHVADEFLAMTEEPLYLPSSALESSENYSVNGLQLGWDERGDNMDYAAEDVYELNLPELLVWWRGLRGGWRSWA